MNRTVLTSFTFLCLSSTVFLMASCFNIQTVKAGGTIYIRGDGSVDPPTAPISSVDNVTYTLTGNILSDADGIVVERSNIMIEGAGYTVLGSPGAYPTIGIDLSARSNITLKNLKIKAFDEGVHLKASSNNTISGNTIIENNNFGIWLWESSNNNTIYNNNIANNYYGVWLFRTCNSNTISGNTITNNEIVGIYLVDSSNTNNIFRNTITANTEAGIILQEASNNNVVYGNNITNNSNGVYFLDSSNNNKFYHNNFVNNARQVYIEETDITANFWDAGYPSGGNYWSDHSGVDLYSGPYQNVTGSDGIHDLPYTIDDDNEDKFPLVAPTYVPLFYFNLTITSTEAGITDPASGTYTYVNGSRVSVTAIPNINYGLAYWELDGSNIGSENPVNILMGDNHTLRAVFTPIDVTPPTTLHDYDGLWHTSDLIITLTAIDEVSGVAETYYRINDGPIKNVSADGQPCFRIVQEEGTIVIDGDVSDWIALGLSPVGTDPPYNIKGCHDISSDLLEAWTYTGSENLYLAMKVNGEGSYDFDWVRYRVFLSTDIELYNVAYFDWYEGKGYGYLFYWDEESEMWQRRSPETLDAQAGSEGYIEWKVPLDLIDYNSTMISLRFSTIDDYYGEEVNYIHGAISLPQQLSTLVTEGANNTLEYWSVDNAGNEELPHNILTGIKLDKSVPTIEIPSRIPEVDVEPDQEVKVLVNVTDFFSAVKNVTLSCNLNDSATWIDSPMILNSTTGLYETIISGQQAGTLVKYKIIAYDNAGNCRVEDNSGEYYVYTVIPEFPSFLILPLFMIATLLAVIVYKRNTLHYRKMKPGFT